MAFLLVMTILLPGLGSLFLFLVPGMSAKSARAVALAVSTTSLGLSLFLLAGFDPSRAGPQFTQVDSFGHYGFDWFPRLGIRFALGLDGISLWLYLLTGLLVVVSELVFWEGSTEGRSPYYHALILSLQAGLLGVFASLDLVLFYSFFEFTLIPVFFLVGVFGGSKRKKAALTYFLTMLAGSLLMLVGLVALVAVAYLHSSAHEITCSIPELTQQLRTVTWAPWVEGRHFGDSSSFFSFWGSPQILICLLLFCGFAIKVPLFPLQTWVPLVYVEAPTSTTILLSGVMAKVGAYGLIRFNLAMTPMGAEAVAPIVSVLATITILYGAFAALVQTDLKRMIAYSSISHMGFIALGLFSLNATGLEGAVLQMVNHGLTTGALFALLGLVFERYQTREIGELGGLWERWPVWSFFVILAALGSAALPGLNGFVGEFPILLGSFRASPINGCFAALGMILGAYYLMILLQKVVFGPLREPATSTERSSLPVLNGRALAGLIPVAILIVLIGVKPAPFFSRVQSSIRPVVLATGSQQTEKPVAALAVSPAQSKAKVTVGH